MCSSSFVCSYFQLPTFAWFLKIFLSALLYLNLRSQFCCLPFASIWWYGCWYPKNVLHGPLCLWLLESSVFTTPLSDSVYWSVAIRLLFATGLNVVFSIYKRSIAIYRYKHVDNLIVPFIISWYGIAAPTLLFILKPASFISGTSGFELQMERIMELTQYQVA